MISFNSAKSVSSSVIPTNQAYVSSRKMVPPRQAIALISEHGDPAAEIGKDAAGGQNVYVRQVGEALAKLGWQVDMFTRKTKPDDAAIVQHAPHCRTIRLVAGPEQFIPRDELFAYMPEFVAAFQAFQSKEGTHYPLIHTNYWMSAWVGLQLKQQSNIQLIHTYHSLGAIKYQTVPTRPAIADTRLAIEQQVLEQADCIVATSPQEQEALRTLVSERGYVEVIPCGTDVSNFHTMPKTEARAALGFGSNESIMLYVGRFDPRKGIETLVKACAQLKANAEHENRATGTALNPAALRLVIVGGRDPDSDDIVEYTRIEQLVRETGLADQTTFAGQIGHASLPLYYTAADVCVIPSHYEPFGLVAIEAMACGTPVVASDVGGLKFTVVPDETGLLVPPQDVEAFTQAIDRVLTDELWAKKLRRQAPIRVQRNFSWSGVAAHLSDLYRRSLAQSISNTLCLGSPDVGGLDNSRAERTQLERQEVYPIHAEIAAPSALTKVS
ncbi:MAG: glycosyltransferase family 1 protein [Stenomitos rutilans HA7619-LM2]|jgi:glycosyltransferase involved in cell wall biosynthesis|nr:glycosyltransferase family 1 protein [Stenomitos rutilans HA7619-LM2]